MAILEKSVKRWSKIGYPYARTLKGDIIFKIFSDAKNQEKQLEGGMSDVWLKKMEKLENSHRKRLLFNRNKICMIGIILCNIWY